MNNSFSPSKQNGPLTDEHYRKLIEAEQILNSVEPRIDKAAQCGVDCQTWRGILAHWREQIASIKQQYFNGPG